MVVHKSQKRCKMDQVRPQHMPKLGLGACLVRILGVTLTRPLYPLICMKTKPMSGLTELGYRTHQFM